MARLEAPAGATLFILGLVTLSAACARTSATSQQLFSAAPAAEAAKPAQAGGAFKIRFSDKPVPVPAFTVRDLDGKMINSADWAGQVVLVNFWATWCGPCREEIPILVALQDHYRGKLIVIGLSVDEQRSPAEVKQFVEQHKINYPVAIASHELQEQFGGISAVPSTFVINQTGGIVQRHLGLVKPAVSEQEVRALAKLPTDVEVEIVKDTGQVLLSNAQFATEIPGLELASLTQGQRQQVLSRLNSEKCTCGCGLTMAQCRINDPTCTVSLPSAQKLVKEVVGK